MEIASPMEKTAFLADYPPALAMEQSEITSQFDGSSVGTPTSFEFASTEDDMNSFDYDDADEDTDPDFMDALLSFQPAKKKRIRIRRRNLIPRLLKTDIRRNYATMFMNVLNSHDSDFFASFARRYAVENVGMQKHCPTECPFQSAGSAQSQFTASSLSQSPLKVISIRGIQQLVDYWALIFEISPDKVVQMEDVQVHTHLHSPNSTITCQFTVNMTRIYDLTPSDVFSMVQENITQAEQAWEGEQTTKKRNRDESASSTTWSLDSVLHRLQQHRSPVPLSAKICGHLTLHVNAAKQIERLDFGAPVFVL